MSMRSLHMTLGLAMLVTALPVGAQTPAKTASGTTTPATTTAAPVKKVDLPTPPANYEYAPQGRRDPFVSLINRGNDGKDTGAATARRADGVPGMLTGELTVRGILQTRGAWVAMVSGPDGKVYTVRAGVRIADGVIQSVNATTVVILQEVNDPLSLDKQREVRKFLRGGGDVK